MTLPTLQDLRYVVALADHGHFGRAAAACDVGQSTLSAQIKKLERQLGVALFERTTKSVSVTAAGAEVARRARQVLAEVEAIGNVGRQASGPLAGRLNLGVIPTLGPYLLPWLVPALRQDYPALRLAVREDLTASLVERLLSHRLDAALLALPVPDERLAALPLFDEPFWFAEPKGGKPGRKPGGKPSREPGGAGTTRAGTTRAGAMSEDDLRGRRLLLLTEGHCLRDQALAICGSSGPGDAESGAEAGIEADADFRATSLETILQMVATGLGSTLLPAMACGGAHAGAVAKRPLEPGLGRRIGLVWRRSYPRVPDLHLLARTLCANLPQGVHPV